MDCPTPNPVCDPFAYAMHGADEVLPVKQLDWNEIVRLAPALLALERDVRALPRRRQRDWREWSDIKRRFSSMVGWGSPNQRLRNPTAYDITYARLLAIWEGAK